MSKFAPWVAIAVVALFLIWVPRDCNLVLDTVHADIARKKAVQTAVKYKNLYEVCIEERAKDE